MAMLEWLKQAVGKATREMALLENRPRSSVTVSARDPETGYIAIRASGKEPALLENTDVVLVNGDGTVIEGVADAHGRCLASGDLPIHLALYRFSANIGAAVLFQPHYATCFAQARRSIPVYGAVHAGAFCGEIPCTRDLTPREASGNCERHIGETIVSAFRYQSEEMVPGCLVAGMGAVAWGKQLSGALQNAALLEEAAHLALDTEQLGGAVPLSLALTETFFYRHHSRPDRHGPKRL